MAWNQEREVLEHMQIQLEPLGVENSRRIPSKKNPNEDRVGKL